MRRTTYRPDGPGMTIASCRFRAASASPASSPFVSSEVGTYHPGIARPDGSDPRYRFGNSRPSTASATVLTVSTIFAGSSGGAGAGEGGTTPSALPAGFGAAPA